MSSSTVSAFVPLCTTINFSSTGVVNRKGKFAEILAKYKEAAESNDHVESALINKRVFSDAYESPDQSLLDWDQTYIMDIVLDPPRETWVDPGYAEIRSARLYLFNNAIAVLVLDFLPVGGEITHADLKDIVSGVLVDDIDRLLLEIEEACDHDAVLIDPEKYVVMQTGDRKQKDRLIWITASTMDETLPEGQIDAQGGMVRHNITDSQEYGFFKMSLLHYQYFSSLFEEILEGCKNLHLIEKSNRDISKLSAEVDHRIRGLHAKYELFRYRLQGGTIRYCGIFHNEYAIERLFELIDNFKNILLEKASHKVEQDERRWRVIIETLFGVLAGVGVLEVLQGLYQVVNADYYGEITGHQFIGSFLRAVDFDIIIIGFVGVVLLISYFFAKRTR